MTCRHADSCDSEMGTNQVSISHYVYTAREELLP